MSFPEPAQFNGSDDRDNDDRDYELEQQDVCQCGAVLYPGEELCPDCARGAAIRSAEGV